MTPTPQRKNRGDRKSLKLQDIAKLVGGELIGDPGLVVTGVAGIKEAQENEVTFLSNSKYLPFLDQTRAAAVITSRDIHSSQKPLIRTQNPSRAFTQVVDFFASSGKSAKAKGVHRTAVIEKGVKLGKGVAVGPHAVIEEGVEIGDGGSIGTQVYIGRNTRIGRNATIYPQVSIREETLIGDNVILHSGVVIGSDGFGYETVGDEHVKIPQIGSVVIEDDVEIGANTCVDRGRFQKTWIKKGSKIDNLVQIAHNVVVGENALIVSQAGISGSTQLGKNVVIAGQAGLVGHITLGDRVVVGARSGVTKSAPDNSVLLGEPARPISEQKRILAATARLPELFKEILDLKKKSPVPLKENG
ncbi:MAG: UDP-3-O-(3-hydroxymyristoyl)glucosamine N-acyltransferase [Candidatus Omnitrophica bacterium]|nr:UDP-3-O-(3-hydroxymyristoyl)glucosamine N-acyltransferase [Candidatus Omnitrophota bacterium]